MSSSFISINHASGKDPEKARQFQLGLNNVKLVKAKDRHGDEINWAVYLSQGLENDPFFNPKEEAEPRLDAA